MSTAGTGPSGTQTAGSQASGAPVTSPTGATGATGPVGSTSPASTTGTTTTFVWSDSLKQTYAAAMSGGLYMILVLVWGIAFHAGAAVLSYRRYGSMGWAILDFFFASLYYPYYVFSLDAPSAPPPLIGGGVLKMLGMGKSRRR